MNYCSYICVVIKVNMRKGRPKNFRRISFIPTISGFVPYGDGVDEGNRGSVIIHYEEYEAIRLNDYEKMNQTESAAAMGVSRPTFTRIYMKAREKMATALIEGRKVIVEGGKVQIDNSWRRCSHCSAIFQVRDDERCALCGGQKIEVYNN